MTNGVSACRLPSIGRKNWMFACPEGRGHNAAITYALIEAAKLNRVDPQAWLTNFLSRIADQPLRKAPGAELHKVISLETLRLEA